MARYSQDTQPEDLFLKQNMRKKVIAIFEDDPVNRFVYERTLLGYEGIEFHIFEYADKGLALAKEVSFDIVFIEMHFWGNFEGLAIMSKLKEICSASTIYVGMTSLLQKDDMEVALNAGFNLCLEKPILFSNMDFAGKAEV
jgi:CheY-like chemotaxis protein